MPLALDESVKDQVRKLWFSGETRKNIAAECQIGAGSVTNIVNQGMKGLGESDLEWIRELAVQLKKEGTTLAEFASIYRRHNYIKKLGANEDQIESLIVNLLNGANSVPNEKIVDLINQLFELSKSESITPAEVPNYVNRKIEEKQRIEAEIKKAGAILHDMNIDMQTIEQYKKLQDELKRQGLSMEDPRRLVSILQIINESGCDPKKIVRELAGINSLRRTERRLKKNCKMGELRATRCKELVPMCKQIFSLGIGFPEMMAFHAAVIKRADMDGIPMGAAPYRVMDDIENYNKLGGMKKELNDIIMNIQKMNLISARQNDAG